MKLLIVCLFVAASVSSEAPNYNSYSLDYQDWRNSAPYPPAGWRPSGPSFGLPARQQELPNFVPPPARQQLPYFAPPSARQQLPNFAPPARQQLPSFAPPQTYSSPEQTYGSPDQAYGPPEQAYGPPPAQEYGPPPSPATTTEAQDFTTTELPPTTTEVLQNLEEAEIVDAKKNNETDSKSDKLIDDNSGVVEQGVYYIYHPTGLLQRIAYVTRDDMEKMAYSAQLKYENVEPIRGPIYTYDAATGALRLIQA